MYPKIIDVKPEDGYMLLVTFETNETKRYDLKPKLVDERFEKLKNMFVFKSVRVDEGGYGISWDDEIDLSEYELWKNGKEIN